MSAPDWILGLLERAAGWGDRKCEGLRQDVEEKRAERAEVVAALRKARANAGAQADEVQFSLELLKVTTAAVLDDAKADDAKPVGPGMAAFSLVSAKLLSSWLVLWIGSWAGLEGARQLGVPPNWQARCWARLPPPPRPRLLLGRLPAPVQALPVELMAWTAPYVGLTLLGHAVAPSLMQRPFHGSGPVTEAAERACLQLPAAGIAAVSFAVAYTQVVVWQGLWLQFTLSLLGAPGFSVSEFVDPMGPELYPERLQAAMGGLVHARLPVLLATPLAVAAVGLLEGGWWVSVEISRQLNPAKLPVSIMGKEEDIDVSPSKLLYGVRIGAAGAFLAAEGLATGSLWLPVLTSAAGLGASLLLLQRRHGGAPPPAQT
eukprot:scaffold19.g1836.t1